MAQHDIDPLALRIKGRPSDAEARHQDQPRFTSRRHLQPGAGEPRRAGLHGRSHTVSELPEGPAQRFNSGKLRNDGSEAEFGTGDG